MCRWRTERLLAGDLRPHRQEPGDGVFIACLLPPRLSKTRKKNQTVLQDAPFEPERGPLKRLSQLKTSLLVRAPSGVCVCAVRLLACGPSGQPGGRLRLPVLVFCPSVLLTGPSIWASAGAVNQMEILSLQRCSDRRPHCCCCFFFLSENVIGILTCRFEATGRRSDHMAPAPHSDTWPLSSAPPSLTSFPYPLPLLSSRVETSGRAWT